MPGVRGWQIGAGGHSECVRGTRPLPCLYQRCPEQRRTHWALSDRGGGRLPAAPASWAADEVSGLGSWTSRSEQPGRTPKAGSRLGCAPRLRRPSFRSPRFQSRPHSHLCPRLAPGRVPPELSPRVFAWKPRALTPVSRAPASAPPRRGEGGVSPARRIAAALPDSLLSRGALLSVACRNVVPGAGLAALRTETRGCSCPAPLGRPYVCVVAGVGSRGSFHSGLRQAP